MYMKTEPKIKCFNIRRIRHKKPTPFNIHVYFADTVTKRV